MKLTRSIIISLLVLFVFIGNVGMSIFTHSCKEDGIFRSYFVQLDDHCEGHEEKVPPCCKKKEVKDKDCCNDEVDVYKIKLDYFSQFQQTIPNLFFEEISAKFDFKLVDENLLSHHVEHYTHPPPRPSGKEILILNQVFRI